MRTFNLYASISECISVKVHECMVMPNKLSGSRHARVSEGQWCPCLSPSVAVRDRPRMHRAPRPTSAGHGAVIMTLHWWGPMKSSYHSFHTHSLPTAVTVATRFHRLPHSQSSIRDFRGAILANCSGCTQHTVAAPSSFRSSVVVTRIRHGCSYLARIG